MNSTRLLNKAVSKKDFDHKKTSVLRKPTMQTKTSRDTKGSKDTKPNSKKNVIPETDLMMCNTEENVTNINISAQPDTLAINLSPEIAKRRMTFNQNFFSEKLKDFDLEPEESEGIQFKVAARFRPFNVLESVSIVIIYSKCQIKRTVSLLISTRISLYRLLIIMPTPFRSHWIGYSLTKSLRRMCIKISLDQRSMMFSLVIMGLYLHMASLVQVRRLRCTGLIFGTM
jgi:hypothetical protein